MIPIRPGAGRAGEIATEAVGTDMIKYEKEYYLITISKCVVVDCMFIDILGG